MANLSEYVGELKNLPTNAGKLDVGVSTAGISWLKLTSEDGTAAYIFTDNSGDLKTHTAEPTDNTDGTVVGGQS